MHGFGAPAVPPGPPHRLVGLALRLAFGPAPEHEQRRARFELQCEVRQHELCLRIFVGQNDHLAHG